MKDESYIFLYHANGLDPKDPNSILVAERIFVNIIELTQDARVLHASGRFRRALFIVMTAIEETAKLKFFLENGNLKIHHGHHNYKLQPLSDLIVKVRDLIVPLVFKHFGSLADEAKLRDAVETIISEPFTNTANLVKVRMALLYEDYETNHLTNTILTREVQDSLTVSGIEFLELYIKANTELIGKWKTANGFL